MSFLYMNCGWQKFVKHIRMLYLGCFILIGSVISINHEYCKYEPLLLVGIRVRLINIPVYFTWQINNITLGMKSVINESKVPPYKI